MSIWNVGWGPHTLPKKDENVVTPFLMGRLGFVPQEQSSKLSCWQHHTACTCSPQKTVPWGTKPCLEVLTDLQHVSPFSKVTWWRLNRTRWFLNTCCLADSSHLVTAPEVSLLFPPKTEQGITSANITKQEHSTVLQHPQQGLTAFHRAGTRLPVLASSPSACKWKQWPSLLPSGENIHDPKLVSVTLWPNIICFHQNITSKMTICLISLAIFYSRVFRKLQFELRSFWWSLILAMILLHWQQLTKGSNIIYPFLNYCAETLHRGPHKACEI